MPCAADNLGLLIPTEKHKATFEKLVNFAIKRAIREGMISRDRLDWVKITVDRSAARSCAGAYSARFHLGSTFFVPNPNAKDIPWTFMPEHAHKKRARSIRSCFAWARMGMFAVNEYASYSDRADIGTFASDDLNECFLVLIAHELTHVVNYNASKNSKWFGRNHDNGFKYTYSVLRYTCLVDYRAWKATRLQEKMAA